MPRPYSDFYLRSLSKTSLATLGIELAKVCVKCNLPMTYVAATLGVSKTAVYNWFRGAGMRESYHARVERLMAIIAQDIDKGVLPVSGPKAAKKYLSGLRGVKG
jgi:hypothetical protein